MRYPISVQFFDELRSEGYAYVDKTNLVYDLVTNHKAVFLGRPRAFGKSLLMSTIQEYFSGNRELFKGLAIDRQEERWPMYPVLRFDMNIGNFSSTQGLLNLLSHHLYYFEVRYLAGRTFSEDQPQFRLRRLIKTIYKTMNVPVVVLIDDYDKPLHWTMEDTALQESFSDILRPFYGVLKSESDLLRFVMLTGLSSSSKFSVLGELNNIEDISLNPKYAEICGFTDVEIQRTFADQINEFAMHQNWEAKYIAEKLEREYGGYRFSRAAKYVCNPSSILRSLKYKEFDNYWYESATPTFLKKFVSQINRDTLLYMRSAKVYEDTLYLVDPPEVSSFLYMTGYLTIKDFEPDRVSFKLGFPNDEVQTSFLNLLLALSPS